MRFKKLFHTNFAPLLALSGIMLFMSCCEDDPVVDPVVVKVDDSEVGAFEEIRNMSSGRTVSLYDGIVINTGKQTAQIYGGDTIKVSFTPKSQYAMEKFNITIEGYKKLNDSLFVAPVGQILKDDTSSESLKMVATCSFNRNDTIYSLSAKQSGHYSYKSAFVFDVDYSYSITSDLLAFVTPVLTYTDENGYEKNVTLTEANMEFSKVTIYQDQDGHRYYLEVGESPEEGWTKIRERPSSYNYYFDSRFMKRSSKLTATVKYTKKDVAQPEDPSLDFSRELSWTARGYINLGITITIGQGQEVTAEKLQAYLEELYQKTDALTLAIDRYGNISSEK